MQSADAVKISKLFQGRDDFKTAIVSYAEMIWLQRSYKIRDKLGDGFSMV